MAAPKGHACYSMTPEGKYLGGRPLEWTAERAEALRLELEEWIKIPTNFWFMDFVLERDIPVDILPKLSRRYETFRATYKKAIKNQEQRVAKGGLFNITNSPFSMFVLKCNHKWVEGTDTTGLDEESETKSTKALDSVMETCIEHTNAIESSSDKPSAS